MKPPLIAQAADGLLRRRFTNQDIVRLIEIGVIDPDESFELIDGDIVLIPSEYDRHVRARMRLFRIFALALDDKWLAPTRGSVFLADNIEFRPDLHVFPDRLRSEDVRGPDVALAVELSESKLDRDLKLKAPLYARNGVPELWVIDLDAPGGMVFTRNENGAFASVCAVGASDLLAPVAFPEIKLKIADLLQGASST